MSVNEKKGLELFDSGYNSAQSVLRAFCADCGLDMNTALKIADRFTPLLNDAALSGGMEVYYENY